MPTAAAAASELERVRRAAAAAGADALEVEVPAGSTGGSGSGVSSGEAAPDGGHGDSPAVLDQELDEIAGTTAAASRSAGGGTHVPPGALQHTDQQEAVQNAAIPRPRAAARGQLPTTAAATRSCPDRRSGWVARSVSP